MAPLILIGYGLAAIVLITAALIFGSAAGSHWCRSVFIAWDYLGAAILGGSGEHSISAYCGRHHAKGTNRLCGALFYGVINKVFGASHCDNAYRTEFPEDFEKE